MLSVLVAALFLGYEPGATMRVYDVGAGMDELPDLVDGQTPNIDKKIDAIDIPDGGFGFKDHFIVEITAEFDAGNGGQYDFRLTSDDGSKLYLDGKEAVDNDGVHAPVAKEGTVRLSQGWHKLKVRFFEHEGGEELKLEWRSSPTSPYKVVDKSVLRVEEGITRVTAPGVKSIKGIGGAKRPGNGMPLTSLHPGWDIMTVRPDWFHPQVGAMAFLPNGDLLVSNFKPNQSGEFLPDLRDGQVFRLSGVEGDDRTKIEVKEVAKDIQEPLGLAVMKDESDPKGYHVYVTQRTEVSELIDADGDGVYEATKTVAKAWIAENYHHFTFGLAEKDGFLFASLSTSITGGAPGINGPNPPNRGTVMKINPKNYNPALPMANCEFISGGHRTPNGIEVGPEGTIMVGENQGAWQPSDKINIVEPGGFYGHYNNTTFKTAQYPNGGNPGPFDEQPLEAPALNLPHNECANSPAQAVFIPSGEFKGQVLISDVKYGGLRRGWFEKVAGVWQGGVVQYSQGFEVGTNRMVWGPDGALYIGGIGATETWAWTDPATGQWTTYGLQRIKPNGKSTFEISKVTAEQGGFTVHFNRPVKMFKPSDVVAMQWNYEPTPEYGGDKKNKETLSVTKIVPKGDGQSFDIAVDGLKKGRTVYLNFGPVRSTHDEELWAAECWYTLNELPPPSSALTEALVCPHPRVLVFSKTAAFRHDSIPDGVKAIEKLGKRYGFEVEATEDSSAFTTANLSKFNCVVFLSTTGDVLNDEQQSAFEKYIETGGGYAGVHAASDCEYDWPWYGRLVGAWFEKHPAIQEAFIKVEDRANPSSNFLPNNWRRVDEWYNFRATPRPNVEVLASLDESSYQGGDMGGDHPIMWCHEVGKGRAWYTNLGHRKETYDEELFLKSLYEGILWTCQAPRPLQAVELKWKPNKWTVQGSSASNGKGGVPDIVSDQKFGDQMVHVEFRIPKGSNSGVYLQGNYEVQVFDSFGKPWKELTFADCGGIYESFAKTNRFEGSAPARAAEKAPGQWNSLDILFRAPRFDKSGKKVENANFVEVRLNGVVVQRNVSMVSPTGAPLTEKEVPTGPLRLQGDHGAVEYRNIWVVPEQLGQ